MVERESRQFNSEVKLEKGGRQEHQECDRRDGSGTAEGNKGHGGMSLTRRPKQSRRSPLGESWVMRLPKGLRMV